MAYGRESSLLLALWGVDRILVFDGILFYDMLLPQDPFAAGS